MQSSRSSPATVRKLALHLEELAGCRRCPDMVGPVVTPRPIAAKVFLVGQAPGPHEGALGRPFAWTAGKTLFRWLGSIGVDEERFRSRAYISAVCRCFPGKTAAGGDRVPSPVEVAACEPWMAREVQLLAPELVIPVGRVAINRFLPGRPLVDVIGQRFRQEVLGHACDLVPLPHPSGASTWFKKEPGVSLLAEALRVLARHPAWQALLPPTPSR